MQQIIKIVIEVFHIADNICQVFKFFLNNVDNVFLFGNAFDVEYRSFLAFHIVDFLVDMEPDRSLFDLGGLLMDLKVLLKQKVDVVTERSLHWYIRDRIIKESKYLWKTTNYILSTSPSA